MTIEAALFAALRGLVADRVYPDTFPQDVPWPAIRYSIVSAVPDVTICGSGGDDATAFRVQIDVVTRKEPERNALRRAVQDAMRSISPPATSAGWQNLYDTETKAYRASLDYLMHPSTEAAIP